MAPSTRKTRTKHVKNEPVSKLSSFGRVSKSGQLNASNKVPSDKQKFAVEELLCEKEKENTEDTKTTSNKNVKRKRSDEEDDEIQKVVERKYAVVKKPKLQLISPPSSQYNTDSELSSPVSLQFQSSSSTRRNVELPSTLKDLVSLHTSFLKAISLHFAHNGSSTPAELGTLMYSTTRIWKKSTVTGPMFQRMLALYELASDSGSVKADSVAQKNGPFKLVTSGLGVGTRTTVELVRGADSAGFQEHNLQQKYEKMVRHIFDSCESDSSSFVHRPLSSFPLLIIPVGTQTQARQEKASATRKEILQLSSAAQSRTHLNFSNLSLSDPLDATPPSVKSRTLSLFDRVRAKSLASSTASAPTNEQVLRQHAIGRIADVVEFIRMKQQQKLGAQFSSGNRDPQSTVKAKISFSLNSIVNEIRQSAAIPLSDEEVRCCIKILSVEVPQWLSCFELGSLTSVTLIGNGVSGMEVKKILEQKEKIS